LGFVGKLSTGLLGEAVMPLAESDSAIETIVAGGRGFGIGARQRLRPSFRPQQIIIGGGISALQNVT
jgi:hypothetical protein